MQVEQIDRNAAEYYGTAIGYPEKDPSGDILRTAFARHRHQARPEVVGEIVAWLRETSEGTQLTDEAESALIYTAGFIAAKFGGRDGHD